MGNQNANKNGDRVLNWLENYNLVLLNGDTKCTGEITWESRGMTSAIDFVLVNQNMYSTFIHMNIDEKKYNYDLSDHNLLSIELQLGEKMCIYSDRVKEIEYMKINEEALQKYVSEMEMKVMSENIEKMETLESYIKEISEKHMKKEVKRRICQGNKIKIEPIWMTSEIRKQISKRRKYNKETRMYG